MTPVQLLAVFVENRPGQTARVTRVLAEAGVNIRWLTIATGSAFGVMKFLVDRTEHAGQLLRQQGLMVSQVEVLAVEVPDRPGALQEVADCLAAERINLENTSGFVANQRAILLIETSERERAQAVLQRSGWRVLGQEEMLNL